MPRRYKPASLLILALALLSSNIGNSSENARRVSLAIQSAGMIDYSVHVNINYANVILWNRLALATQDTRPLYFPQNPVLLYSAKACNFALIRLFVGNWGMFGLNPCTMWDEAQHEGSYDWSSLDNWIEAVQGIGAEPLLCIGGKGRLPMGMSENPSSEEGWPLFIDDFAKYCSDIVCHCNIEKHYAVRYWEIWNEARWWDADSISEFTAIFNVAQAQMRAVDPSILVGNDRCASKAFADHYVDHIKGLDFASFHRTPRAIQLNLKMC